MRDIVLAGCIILNEHKEILLLHRNTERKTQWEIPGGKREPGETPEQTAVREIKEEIGVDIILETKLGEKTFAEGEYVMNYIWFLAKVTTGTPSIGEPDTYDGLEYFSVQKLSELPNLSPNTKNLLEAIHIGSIPALLSLSQN